jgi:hypothetical protein
MSTYVLGQPESADVTSVSSPDGAGSVAVPQPPNTKPLIAHTMILPARFM